MERNQSVHRYGGKVKHIPLSILIAMLLNTIITWGSDLFLLICRGSVTVKQGSSCSIHGLVAHLSTLACGTAYEKAGSLRTRLSAEMFPRLEIWPPTFFKHGPPTDGDIALYFFPSCDRYVYTRYNSLTDI